MTGKVRIDLNKAGDIYLVVEEPPDDPLSCRAQVRMRPKEARNVINQIEIAITKAGEYL